MESFAARVAGRGSAINLLDTAGMKPNDVKDRVLRDMTKSEERVNYLMTKKWPWKSRSLRGMLAFCGIPYEELNVATDTKAREEMLEKSQQLGVPVIDVDGTIIIGFDKKNLEMALELGTYAK